MIAAFIVLNSDLTTTNKALFTALHRRVAKVNILITNLHWLLFIHKIYSSTCFEPQVLIFRRIQLYTCSIWYCHTLREIVVACRCTAVHRQATTISLFSERESLLCLQKSILQWE